MRRNEMKGSPMVTGIIIGTGAAMGLMLLLSAVVTWMVESERLEVTAMGWMSVVVQAISTFLGTWVALTVGKEKLAVMTGSIAGSILIILIACSMLIFSNGFYNLIGGILAVLVSAAAACLIKLKAESKTKRSKKRAFR